MILADYLVYEEKDKLIKVDIPKDFCCILTLNPNKGQFSGKRQELPESYKINLLQLNFQKRKGKNCMQ